MEQKTFAFMLENPLIDHPSIKCGLFNGYVGIHKSIELPNSDMLCIQNDLDDSIGILDGYISVHGGITLDKLPGDYKISRHKIYPITMIPDDYDENYRIIGFDTAHCYDNKEKWGYNEVRDETICLFQQINKLIEKQK